MRVMIQVELPFGTLITETSAQPKVLAAAGKLHIHISDFVCIQLDREARQALKAALAAPEGLQQDCEPPKASGWQP